MKVHLRELPCERRLELSNAFVRDAIATLPMRAALERSADDPAAGAASVEVSIIGEEENIFVSGHMSGWLEVACSRCVGPVRVEFDEQLRVTYLPRAQVPPEDEIPEEGVEITEDDLDVFPYDGDEIDLEPLVREQVILSVPYAPLCKDDCQGLCTVCGADLNRETCQCDRDVVDPRLAALKDIKV